MCHVFVAEAASRLDSLRTSNANDYNPDHIRARHESGVMLRHGFAWACLLGINCSMPFMSMRTRCHFCTASFQIFSAIARKTFAFSPRSDIPAVRFNNRNNRAAPFPL